MPTEQFQNNHSLAANETPVPSTSVGASPMTVLVVEDNPDVRMVAEDLLTLLGYRVTCVERASEALEILHTDQHVDLIFTDIVLPGGLDGKELMIMAQNIRPGIRVLATSGYALESLGTDCSLPNGVMLLTKPYSMQALEAALQDTLAVEESSLVA